MLARTARPRPGWPPLSAAAPRRSVHASSRKPLPIGGIRELAHRRQNRRIPLATGERRFAKCGLAQTCHRIERPPYNPQSGVGTPASLHVVFSTPHVAIQQITHRGNDPCWQDLFQGGAIRYEKGFALPPDRPGLGVALDENVAAKRPYQPHTCQQLRFVDGGIADH